MNLIQMKSKVKICFKCGQYIYIHPNNPVNIELVKRFDFDHYKHPIQTIPINEVPNEFELIKQ